MFWIIGTIVPAYSPVPNNRGGGGSEKSWLKVITPITSYACPEQNFFAPYLDIVDTGATITLNKIRKANQSNFIITQSKNI